MTNIINERKWHKRKIQHHTCSVYNMSGSPNSLAKPKSASLIIFLASSISKFFGFKSLWRILCA